MSIKLYKILAIGFFCNSILFFPGFLALFTVDGRIDYLYLTYGLYFLSILNLVMLVATMYFRWSNGTILKFGKRCVLGTAAVLLLAVLIYPLDAGLSNIVNLNKHFDSRPAVITDRLLSVPELWADSTLHTDVAFLKYIDEKISKAEPVDWNITTPLKFSYHLCNQWFLMYYDILYERTHDVGYLLTAKDLIFDWIDRVDALNHYDRLTIKLFKKPVFKAPLTWNDDCSANRIVYQTILFQKLYQHGLVNDSEAETFFRNVVRHARFISDHSNYNSRTNHGLMQNRALLHIALSFPELKQSTEWRELAIARMEDQVLQNFTVSGIHKEYSALYHYYAVQEVSWFFLVCKKNGLPVSDAFEAKLRLMWDYLADLLLPDNSLPMLGDTHKQFIVSLHNWPLHEIENWPEVKRLRDVLDHADGRTAFYKQYGPDGIAIYKNYSTDRNTYLLFNAAPERTAHIHYDALSFIFYRDGSIFEGPGYYYYDDGDLRQKNILAKYQNTVSVDDHDFEFGSVKLLFSDFDPNTQLFLASGEQTFTDNIRIQRSFLYSHAKEIIFIIDELSSDRLRSYSQNFRISDEISIASNATNGHSGILLQNSNGQLISVQSMLYSNGELSNPEQTFHSRSNFSFNCQEQSIVYVTSINLDQKNHIEVAGAGNGVRIVSDDLSLTVDLPVLDSNSIVWQD